MFRYTVGQLRNQTTVIPSKSRTAIAKSLNLRLWNYTVNFAIDGQIERVTSLHNDAPVIPKDYTPLCCKRNVLAVLESRPGRPPTRYIQSDKRIELTNLVSHGDMQSLLLSLNDL